MATLNDRSCVMRLFEHNHTIGHDVSERFVDEQGATCWASKCPAAYLMVLTNDRRHFGRAFLGTIIYHELRLRITLGMAWKLEEPQATDTSSRTHSMSLFKSYSHFVATTMVSEKL
jgi:hypothetical protein